MTGQTDEKLSDKELLELYRQILLDGEFVCAWCEEAHPDEPMLYTYDVASLIDFDFDTGLPLCGDCADLGEDAE